MAWPGASPLRPELAAATTRPGGRRIVSLPPAALDGRAMRWWLARRFSTWRRQFLRGSGCPLATTWKGVYCWKALKSRPRSLVWQAGNQRKRLPRLALQWGLLPLLHWRRGLGGGGGLLAGPLRS